MESNVSFLYHCLAALDQLLGADHCFLDSSRCLSSLALAMALDLALVDSIQSFTRSWFLDRQIFRLFQGTRLLDAEFQHLSFLSC